MPFGMMGANRRSLESTTGESLLKEGVGSTGLGGESALRMPRNHFHRTRIVAQIANKIAHIA